MNLEDKIKPYLILGKLFEFQILQLKDNPERLERLTNLRNLVLQQMLYQFNASDIPIVGIIDEFYSISKIDEFHTKKTDETLEPLSKLINELKLEINIENIL